MRLPGRAHRRRSLRSLVGQVLLRKSAQDGRFGHHGERCRAKHFRGTQAVGQSRQTPPSGSRDPGLGLRIGCGMPSPLYFGKISSLHNNTHFVSQTLYMNRIKDRNLISSKVKLCLRRLRLRRGGSFCFGEVQLLSRRHLEHGRSRVRRISKQVLLGRRRRSSLRSDISKKLIIVQGSPSGSLACAELLH